MRDEKRISKDQKTMDKKSKIPLEAEFVIVWTSCTKCGDTWGTQAVTVQGRCRICGGKAKAQEVISNN